MSSFTHFDEQGNARMVDVSTKEITTRKATAKVSVLMANKTLDSIISRSLKKGDVLQVARLAGIMASKRTSDLIPLCHPVGINHVEIQLSCDTSRNAVDIAASCGTESRTGIEMEALTAASVAALTVYDMCKSVDRGMKITELRLTEKSGGKSGDFSQS